MASYIAELLKTGLVRAVVIHKDDCIWVWAYPAAYNAHGCTCEPLRVALRNVPMGKLRGHDDDHRLFNLRRGRGAVVVYA